MWFHSLLSRDPRKHSVLKTGVQLMTRQLWISTHLVCYCSWCVHGEGTYHPVQQGDIPVLFNMYLTLDTQATRVIGT